MGRALALDLFPDRVLDDIVHDVGRRVIDSAGLSHLRLFFDLGLMALGQPDDLAQEPLINRAQDLDGQHAEVIGRPEFEIEALQDRFDHLVVDGEIRRDPVGRVGDAGFLLKMKQARVVFFVGFAAQVAHEAGIDVGPLAQLEQLFIGLDPPVFGHAQKHDAVDRQLDGGVQIVQGKIWVAKSDVAGQLVAPALDLLQEFGVHFGGAALPLGGGVLVEGARPNGLAREIYPTIPASGRDIPRIESIGCGRGLPYRMAAAGACNHRHPIPRSPSGGRGRPWRSSHIGEAGKPGRDRR